MIFMYSLRLESENNNACRSNMVLIVRVDVRIYIYVKSELSQY